MAKRIKKEVKPEPEYFIPTSPSACDRRVKLTEGGKTKEDHILKQMNKPWAEADPQERARRLFVLEHLNPWHAQYMRGLSDDWFPPEKKVDLKPYQKYDLPPGALPTRGFIGAMFTPVTTWDIHRVVEKMKEKPSLAFVFEKEKTQRPKTMVDEARTLFDGEVVEEKEKQVTAADTEEPLPF